MSRRERTKESPPVAPEAVKLEVIAASLERTTGLVDKAYEEIASLGKKKELLAGDITPLQAKVEEIQKSLAAEQERFDEQVRENDQKLIALRFEYEREKQEQGAELSKKRKELDSAQQSLDEIRRTHATEVVRLNTLITNVKAEAEREEQKLKNLKESEHLLRVQLAGVLKSIDAKRAELTGVEDAIVAARASAVHEIETVQKSLESSRTRAQELAAQDMKKQESAIEKLGLEIAELNRKKRDADTAHKNVVSSLAEVSNKLERANQEYQTVQRTLGGVIAKASDIERRERVLKEKLEKVGLPW